MRLSPTADIIGRSIGAAFGLRRRISISGWVGRIGVDDLTHIERIRRASRDAHTRTGEIPGGDWYYVVTLTV